MAGIDANAQGFVAAVFGHDTVAELTGQQQREPVPGLGATDAIAPPRDDWKPSTPLIAEIRNQQPSPGALTTRDQNASIAA